MRRIGALALVLVFGWIMPFPSVGATVMGSGVTISCGGWVEVRKGGANKQLIEEWALGYLSGVSIWTPESPLDNLDAAAVFVWLDNACQQRPLEPFKEALDAFVRVRAAAKAPQAAPQARPPANPPPAAGPARPPQR